MACWGRGGLWCRPAPHRTVTHVGAMRAETYLCLWLDLQCLEQSLAPQWVLIAYLLNTFKGFGGKKKKVTENPDSRFRHRPHRLAVQFFEFLS